MSQFLKIGDHPVPMLSPLNIYMSVTILSKYINNHNRMGKFRLLNLKYDLLQVYQTRERCSHPMIWLLLVGEKFIYCLWVCSASSEDIATHGTPTLPIPLSGHENNEYNGYPDSGCKLMRACHIVYRVQMSAI